MLLSKILAIATNISVPTAKQASYSGEHFLVNSSTFAVSAKSADPALIGPLIFIIDSSAGQHKSFFRQGDRPLGATPKSRLKLRGHDDDNQQ